MLHDVLGRRVVIVGAHPDDLEMNAGGTIHRLSNEGVMVRCVTLTGGPLPEGHPVAQDASTRKNEAMAAHEHLHTPYRVWLPYEDRFLHTWKTQAIEHLDRLIKGWDPDTIITHFHADTHQDHVTAWEVTAAAARNVKNFLMFKPTFPSGRTDIPFQPTFVSQLSAENMVAKLAAMNEFTSQKAKYGEDAWLNSLRQTAAGDAWTYGGFHGYAEIFQVSRMRA